MAELDHDDMVWRKSATSGGGDCVEVAQAGDLVFVRNSHEPDGPVLSFTLSQWNAFVEGARSGTFDFGGVGS